MNGCVGVCMSSLGGKGPSKRYGHTITHWNNTIIVFGGCNEFQEYCNDIYIFNLSTLTWTNPRVNTTVSARYLHSATLYEDKLFIYGGFARSMECTYVLDELDVLDLKTMEWTKYQDLPPRYNHSATLIDQRLYIYGGKDEHGSTVSDLFMINLRVPPYTPRLILSNSQAIENSKMVLLKSQHFCAAVCGKLFVFGRYLSYNQQSNTSTPDAGYSLWTLDLDTLQWERQECDMHFEGGGWNYFTAYKEYINESDDCYSQVVVNNLLFLGNIDSYRPQGYDHFRDALIINSESLGLYDIGPPRCLNQLSQLLVDPELSDFTIAVAGGQEIQVHRVILITRWPYFRNMHDAGMTEALERRLTIPESYAAVMALLKYLYSDQLDEGEPWQVVCQVLELANIYLVHRLKKVCCERLYRKHMSVESCSIIFEKAILTDEMGLKMLSLDFIFRNYGAVIKSNILMHMPRLAYQEFLEAVPDEAVLDIHHSSGDLVRVAPKRMSLSVLKNHSSAIPIHISDTSIHRSQTYTSVRSNRVPDMIDMDGTEVIIEA
ncbi:hypothetical protein BDF14DRAFT_837150 [Spinellus fusiger]|nr:hypothetical protein BDF14DRAFT_837150 [Spinellus fusiger]